MDLALNTENGRKLLRELVLNISGGILTLTNMLIDTHAHIHQDVYDSDRDEVMARAVEAGVTKIIAIGVDDNDSKLAIDLANSHDSVWATVGLHPHDAKLSQKTLEAIKDLATNPKVVAIGECGLDYYYEHSPKRDQIKAFQAQIDIAQAVDKPLVFHVREAFDDFFRVLENYKGVRGVVHCFTGDEATLNKVLDQGFYVGYNGIMTFTKYQYQLAAAKACPLDRMLLETDCPYLTPAPHRGQCNEPAHTKIIAEFLANLRGESAEELSVATTKNAEALFGLL